MGSRHLDPGFSKRHVIRPQESRGGQGPHQLHQALRKDLLLREPVQKELQQTPRLLQFLLDIFSRQDFAPAFLPRVKQRGGRAPSKSGERLLMAQGYEKERLDERACQKERVQDRGMERGVNAKELSCSSAAGKNYGHPLPWSPVPSAMLHFCVCDF